MLTSLLLYCAAALCAYLAYDHSSTAAAVRTAILLFTALLTGLAATMANPAPEQNDHPTTAP